MKQKALLLAMAVCMAFPGTAITASGKEQAAVEAVQKGTADENTNNKNEKGTEYSDVSVLTGEPIDPEQCRRLL